MKTPSNKPRFSLLRFSLRFMLLIVFAAACLLGWVSWEIQNAKAELQLARELESAGHSVSWGVSDVGEHEWPEPGWNFHWLRNHLFSHVDSVTFRDSEITSLELLKPFRNLTKLSLDCPLLEDVAALPQFPNLKTLKIFGCKYVEDLRLIIE